MGVKVNGDVLLGAEDLLVHIARGLRSLGPKKGFFANSYRPLKRTQLLPLSVPQRLRAGLINAAAIAAGVSFVPTLGFKSSFVTELKDAGLRDGAIER